MPVHSLPSESGRLFHADVCVIGAGMAGLVAALRLAEEKSRRILVVESGGYGFDPAIHGLNVVEDAFQTYQHAVDGRYRGLGGSSSQWGGKLLPLSPTDVAERPYLDEPGWPLPLAELARYREDIERLFQLDRESYEEDALDLWDRKREMPRGDADFVLRYPKWPAFRRCHLGNLLGAKLAAAENLQVWLQTTVCGFVFDPETRLLRAISARNLAGATVRVEAREFLCAAGTIETTRLLLLLHEQSGGSAFPQCQVLGRYFQDHLGAHVGNLKPRDWERSNGMFGYHFLGATRRSQHLELSPAAQQAARVASGFAHVTIAPGAESPMIVLKKLFRGLQHGDLRLSKSELLQLCRDPWALVKGAYWRFGRRQLYWPPDINLQLNVWIEQLPRWENRITLSEQMDPLGVPKVRLEWRPGEREEKTFQTCVQSLQKYWPRHGLDRYCELVWREQIRTNSTPILELADDRLHPSGSTRMGNNPVTSVVRPDLGAHEVKNLHVASASVFPTAGSANPTYTILQIALHAAAGIASQLR